MKFEIRHCSVLDAGADIIVNAANNNLMQGGGVCGAIFERAGAKELEEECFKCGFVATGSAVITQGLNSGAKYIIHAVGPRIWANKHDWKERLRDAYLNSLKIAESKEVESIAFPCISVGIYGCPIREAAEIAINTIKNFEAKHLKICYLCCFTEEEFEIYNELRDKI